jgi:hypothetical protein
MKAKTVAFILLAVLLTLFTTPVYAQGDIPPLPHAFYGAVEVNDSPAPAGTNVEVRGEGVQTGVEGNPIVTVVVGIYGSSNPLEPKLIVQGAIVDGVILTFYVNGVSTEQTAEWHSGEVTEINLTVSLPSGTTEPPPPGTTEPPPPGTTEPPPPETTEPPAPKPAAFSLSSLILSPNEVALGESVTISVEVANTGEETGNYKVTLKIDGVVEASKEITVNAGASQKVTFTTVKNLAGTYAVDINGLSSTFVVKEEAPPPSTPPELPAPTPPEPTPPAKPVNWPVLGGVIGGVIMVGLMIFSLVRRRAY